MKKAARESKTRLPNRTVEILHQKILLWPSQCSGHMKDVDWQYCKSASSNHTIQAAQHHILPTLQQINQYIWTWKLGSPNIHMGNLHLFKGHGTHENQLIRFIWIFISILFPGKWNSSIRAVAGLNYVFAGLISVVLVWKTLLSFRSCWVRWALLLPHATLRFIFFSF
jgi:hypothetical protein